MPTQLPLMPKLMPKLTPKLTPKQVVLVGGGHSHAIALHLLGRHPLAAIRLLLISETADTPYSGMLPGHLAGFYTRRECHIHLPALARFAQAEFLQERAIALDLEQRQVICANHPPVNFDLLSIDIGSTPTPPATLEPESNEFWIPVKPWRQFLGHWDRLLEQVADHPDRPLTLGVVGGGAAGVEMTLAVQYHLQQVLQAAQQPPTLLTLHLFHQGTEVMTGHNAGVQRRFAQTLQQRGVQLHLGERGSAVTGSVIECESGLRVSCDRVFWATQAAAPAWVRASGLATDADGFIQVRETLQSCSHDFVFATGDIAAMVQHPRPKAGVFAVRQGPPLFKNLSRLVSGQPLLAYRPQRRFLSLVTTGDRNAVASWGPLSWESPWLWSWKDWIDRRFMNQFHQPE